MNYRRIMSGLPTSNANVGSTPIADEMLRNALTRKPLVANTKRPLLCTPTLDNAQPARSSSTSVTTTKHTSRVDDKSQRERSPLDDRRLKRKRDESTYHERSTRSRYSPQSQERNRSPNKYARSSYKSYRSPPKHYRHGSPVRYDRDRSRSPSYDRNRRSNGGRNAHFSLSPIRNHSTHYHRGSYQGYNRGRAGFRGGYYGVRGRAYIHPGAFSYQQPTLHYHHSPQKTEVQKNSLNSSVPQKNALTPPRRTIEDQSNLVTRKPHMATESSHSADVAKMLNEFRKQQEGFYRSRNPSPVRQQRRRSPSPVRTQTRQRRSMSLAPTRFDRDWRNGPSINPKERSLHPKETGRYSYLEKEHLNSRKDITLPRNDALGNSHNVSANFFFPPPARSAAIPHSQLKEPCIVNAGTIQAANFNENLATVNNLHNYSPQKPSSSYTRLNVLPTVRIGPLRQSIESGITTVQSTVGIAPTPQIIEKPIANVQPNQTQSLGNSVNVSSLRATNWNPSNDWGRNDFSVPPPSIGTLTVPHSEEQHITNGHMSQAQTFNHHSSSSSSEDDKRDSDNEAVGNNHESQHAVYDLMPNKVDISDDEDNGDTDTSPDKDSPERSDEIHDEIQLDHCSDGEAEDKNMRMRKLFSGRCVMDNESIKIMSQSLRPQSAVHRVYPLPLRKAPPVYVEEKNDESVGTNDTTRSQGQLEEHLTTTETFPEHHESVKIIPIEQVSHYCLPSHVEQQVADKMAGDCGKDSRTIATLTPTKVVYTVPPPSVIRNIPPPTFINPPALRTEEQVHNVVTDGNGTMAYYNTQVAPDPMVSDPVWIGKPPPIELMPMVAWGNKARQNGCRRMQTNGNPYPKSRDRGTLNKQYSF